MAKNTSSKQAKQRSKRRLGRGLQSLINQPAEVDFSEAEEHPSNQNAVQSATAQPDNGDATGNPSNGQNEPARAVTNENAPTGTEQAVQAIPVEMIEPNPFQPRHDFDDSTLDSLAASIASAGVMQPVVVRPAEHGEEFEGDAPSDCYQLIAGERRWRAARKLGLKTIPAIVREIDHRTAAEWALVENVQREDLDPLERAQAFDRLYREFQLTHQEIAEQVGLNRASVTNHLRLLELGEETKRALREGRLTMGHARALLAITNTTERSSLARQAIKSMWSVRRLEQAIRARNRSDSQPKPGQANQSAAAMQTDSIASQISEAMGTNVSIKTGRKKGTGKLIIDFYSLEQFEGLLERLQINVND